LLLAAQHNPVLILIHRLTLPDLTPNTGLWWYFFTEMFDHFRPFFLMVFSVCFPLVPGSDHKLTIFTGPSPDIRSACVHQIPVRLQSKNSIKCLDKPIQTRSSLRYLHSVGYPRNIQAIHDTLRPWSLLEHDRHFPRDLSM